MRTTRKSAQALRIQSKSQLGSIQAQFEAWKKVLRQDYAEVTRLARKAIEDNACGSRVAVAESLLAIVERTGREFP